MSDENTETKTEIEVIKIAGPEMADEFFAYVVVHPTTGHEVVAAAGPIEMVADLAPKFALLRIADIEVKLCRFKRSETLDEVEEAIVLRDSKKALAAHKAAEKAEKAAEKAEGKQPIGFMLPTQGEA